MSGSANTCPICMRGEILRLMSELDKVQQSNGRLVFRDGQLAMDVKYVLEEVQRWGKDVAAAFEASAFNGSSKDTKDIAVNRLIAFKGVEKLLKEILKKLMPEDDVKAKRTKGT